MDLGTRLRGINPTNTVVYSREPRALNFKISKLAYLTSIFLLILLSLFFFLVCFAFCQGDEMGMLEDACVGIASLTCVKFKVGKKIDLSFDLSKNGEPNGHFK